VLSSTSKKGATRDHRQARPHENEIEADGPDMFRTSIDDAETADHRRRFLNHFTAPGLPGSPQFLGNSRERTLRKGRAFQSEKVQISFPPNLLPKGLKMPFADLERHSATGKNPKAPTAKTDLAWL